MSDIREFLKEKGWLNEILNMDCMDLMKELPDKCIDLAITDPPYGIDITNQSQGKGGGLAKKNNYKNNNFDKNIPNKKYFDELFRVSKNQIIWGGNYFIEHLKNTSCFIVWDKDNSTTDYADCELAWCSFKTATRKFKFKWMGMLQENMKNKEKRIHPTQKPIALYRWILQKYAKSNDLILDTHSGSGSLVCACDVEGFDFVVSELDEDYWKDSKIRFLNEKNKRYIDSGFFK